MSDNRQAASTNQPLPPNPTQPNTQTQPHPAPQFFPAGLTGFLGRPVMAGGVPMPLALMGAQQSVQLWRRIPRLKQSNVMKRCCQAALIV